MGWKIPLNSQNIPLIADGHVNLCEFDDVMISTWFEQNVPLPNELQPQVLHKSFDSKPITVIAKLYSFLGKDDEKPSVFFCDPEQTAE